MKLVSSDTLNGTAATPRKVRVAGAAVGAAGGALAGFILMALGLGAVVAAPNTPDWAFFGALIGAAIGAFGRQRVVLVADGVLLAVYLLIAYLPIMDTLAPRWVRSDPVTGPADAIVVLSASVKSDSVLNAEGTERLLTGLELLRRGVAPRLFTTAVEAEYPSGVRSSVGDQRRLIELAGGLPAWTSLTDVHITRDEAVKAAEALSGTGRTVVVVTSPMHTRRACATFEGVGLRVICVPAAERRDVTRHPGTSVDRLASFRDYLYERLGMVKYRAKGWLK
jgi:uncharacterized SAM-binding protein YcdF (DUF218 family)